MRCRHCQNYPISCELPLEQYSKAPDTSPEALLHQLQKSETSILSYTYAEPTISYEYLLDTSKLVRKAGYYTVLVSNGFLNPAPWHELLPWINAMNIDIKGNEEIYDQECAAPGAYKRVLENVRRAYQSGVHVEITTLLIPRIHDKIINQLVNDIEGISRDIVWHISAYFPQYRSSAPPTSAQRVREVAAMIRNRGFRYVYTGNI
nr:radical SAM protein [Desulfurispira natronophila]